ncbi:MAG: hypothetical protein R2781_00825 [Flavobacteriaceae bacterium]
MKTFFSTLKEAHKVPLDLSLLVLITITVPFSINICNLFIIISFLYSLYLLVTKQRKPLLFNFLFIFPFLFFIVTIISALLSKNLDKGVTEINKALLFFIIPFIILILYQKKEYLSKLLFGFLLSTTVSTLILLCHTAIKYVQGNSLNTLFFHEFTRLYDQHPVYFSLNIALSVFILNALFFKQQALSKKSSLLFTATSLILFLGILFCASKIILVIFFILYSIQILSVTIKQRVKVAIIGTFLLLGSIAITKTDLGNRFQEVLKTNFIPFSPTQDIKKAKVFSYNEKETISDLELRLLIAKIGLFHQIKDRKLLFGYGVGDTQDYLDYYYMTYGLAPNWYEGHNLHNQYLQIWVTYGILFFMVFIGYLFASAHTYFTIKNNLFIFFIVTVLIAFLFESYLVRNKGIIFFFFFNSVFLAHSYLVKQSKKPISL